MRQIIMILSFIMKKIIDDLSCEVAFSVNSKILDFFDEQKLIHPWFRDLHNMTICNGKLIKDIFRANT